jgi:hypothetical protein
MADADGSQVRGTGRKGFLESTLRRNLDDSDNYEDIGSHNDQEAASFIKHRND